MAITKNKKKFFDVEIPSIGKITQVQAYEISEIEGRFIKYDLTRMLKGKSIEAQFIIKVEGQKAHAFPLKMKLMSYFLRRAVRKGTNYVEDSFDAECKNEKLKIKPFIVTRRKVPRSVRNALRKKAKEEIISYIQDKESNEIFDDILRNKFQKLLSLKLKKIYPLSLCEIRILEIVKKK